jgi:hypothetical protein
VKADLLVVAVVEGAVGNTHVGLEVVAVRVLAVAVKQGQGSHEVSFLQKVACVRQLHLFLKGHNKVKSWLRGCD